MNSDSDFIFGPCLHCPNQKKQWLPKPGGANDQAIMVLITDILAIDEAAMVAIDSIDVEAMADSNSVTASSCKLPTADNTTVVTKVATVTAEAIVVAVGIDAEQPEQLQPLHHFVLDCCFHQSFLTDLVVLYCHPAVAAEGTSFVVDVVGTHKVAGNTWRRSSAEVEHLRLQPNTQTDAADRNNLPTNFVAIIINEFDLMSYHLLCE